MRKLLLSLLEKQSFLLQFFKYILTGILTNIIGYAAYWVITNYGFSPKWTVTVLYGISALLNFLANRWFTFRHNGHLGRASIRYILAQFAGYLLDILILILFVDWLGYAHQYVQAAAVFAVAFFLFILSRYFVFAPDKIKKFNNL